MEIFTALAGAMAVWTTGFWMGVVFVVAFIGMSFSVTYSYRTLGDEFEYGYAFVSMLITGIAAYIMHLAALDVVSTLCIFAVVAVITTGCKFLKHIFRTKQSIESLSKQVRGSYVDFFKRAITVEGQTTTDIENSIAGFVSNSSHVGISVYNESDLRKSVIEIAGLLVEHRKDIIDMPNADFKNWVKSHPAFEILVLKTVSIVSKRSYPDIYTTPQGGIEVRSKALTVRVISWFFVWPFVAIELCFGSFLPAIASFFGSIFSGFTGWVVRTIFSITGFKI